MQDTNTLNLNACKYCNLPFVINLGYKIDFIKWS